MTQAPSMRVVKTKEDNKGGKTQVVKEFYQIHGEPDMIKFHQQFSNLGDQSGSNFKQDKWDFDFGNDKIFEQLKT